MANHFEETSDSRTKIFTTKHLLTVPFSFVDMDLVAQVSVHFFDGVHAVKQIDHQIYNLDDERFFVQSHEVFAQFDRSGDVRWRVSRVFRESFHQSSDVVAFEVVEAALALLQVIVNRAVHHPHFLGHKTHAFEEFFAGLDELNDLVDRDRAAVQHRRADLQLDKSLAVLEENLAAC
jgi:hypothetical protein